MKSTTPAAIQMSLPGFDKRPHFAEVSRDRLSTNTTANRHAVHRWFNFIAGFAPEFVAAQCPKSDSKLLLDPFAGCGTSLVVAQSLGHRAVGFEPHPFFVRIARAKTEPSPSLSRLRRIEEALLVGIQTPERAVQLSALAEAFLVKLFDETTLRQLLGARMALQDTGLDSDNLAFLMLSRIVDMCSGSKTDGIYKAPTSAKRAELPSTAVRSVVEEVRRDVAATPHTVVPPTAKLYQRSAEDMSAVETCSVDVAVTSPPYLNNFDFAEMTRMHLYFWGMCGSWREITAEVRAKLIVNTTTALTGHRNMQSHYRAMIADALLPELDAIVSALAQERRIRAGKKEYDLLVYPYFAQMTRVLLETQRCLSLGGLIHVVVADAAFYGVHVSTPQFLASVMADMGFKAVQCIKLRNRGHRWILSKRDGSPSGLGEYHVVAQRENIS
jgi:DNA modification methylase